MTTLQDIMGLITKRKIKTPSDNDYIISAAYSDTQERLKPQPKMEASLLSLGGIKKYVLASIAPPKYKVFTALLTQTGGDKARSINFNNMFPLVVGVTYTISVNLPLNEGGTDFTNVGAPDNNIGTSFIATGTTPIWGQDDGQLQFNEGAPVATVLENTIGNIWFTFVFDGQYNINKENNFDLSKTAIFIGPPTWDGGDYYFQAGPDGVAPIYLVSKYLQTLANVNNAFLNTPIEIKVYN